MTAFEDRLALAESRIGYGFRDRRLLAQALTHASGKSETAPSNERLEFLGDSVLGVVVARHLYLARPSWDEGELTRVKSAVVSAASLAEAARSLGILECVVVGKGMIPRPRPHGEDMRAQCTRPDAECAAVARSATAGAPQVEDAPSEATVPPSILANVFEALVAAIHLDGGDAAAERFVLSALATKIAGVASEAVAKNWKSLLQQHAQRAWMVTPTYRVVGEAGPEHEKRFRIVACLGERGEMGEGEGRSKKEAEQRAAEAALRAVLGDRADEVREHEPFGPATPAPRSTDGAQSEAPGVHPHRGSGPPEPGMGS